MCGYDFVKELGRGGNATVHLVSSKTTKKRYACKQIPKVLDPTQFSERKISHHEENVRREIAIMQKFRHQQRIVQLKETYEDERNFYLVMDNCEGGNVANFVEDHKDDMDESKVRDIIKECLKTLAVCHNHDVIHNDVKPENFLLEEKDDISSLRLIDFGISIDAAHLDADHVSFESTPWYSSPESLSSKHSKKNDVWQIGVMTHLLLTGRFPFNDKKNPYKPSVYKIWNSVLNDDIDFQKKYWKSVSETGKDFISRLLVKDPEKRPTIFEAMTHPWITNDACISKNIGLMVIDNMNKYYKKNIEMRTLYEDFIDILEEKYKDRLNTCGCMESDLEDSSLYHTDKAIISLNSDRLSYILHILREKFKMHRESVTPSEFKTILKRLNSKQKIDEMLEKTNLPTSEKIDMKSIIASQIDWNKLIEENNRFEEFLADVFGEMDKNNTGYIHKSMVKNSCGVLFDRSFLSFQEFFERVNTFVEEHDDVGDARVHGSTIFGQDELNR